MKRARDGPRYAELCCQSAFSFLRGASDPETLVERAAELGYAALALTDRDGLYGSPRLHAAGRTHGLPVIHGTTLTLARAAARAYDGRPEGADHRLVLLARHEGGWRRLCRLVSAARAGSRTEPVTSLEALLAACAPDAGTAHTAHTARDARHVRGPRRASPTDDHGLIALLGPHLPDAAVGPLLDAFGREHCALSVHDRLLKRDRRGRLVQQARAAHHALPLVVTGGVRFARRQDKPLHDVLTCVRHGLSLDEAATRLLPNAEFCLRPVTRIARLFADCPEALAHSVELAERCRWSLDALAYRFPPFDVPAGETAFSQLHDLAHAGARRRYRPVTPAVARQLGKELDMIERLDMAGYFLVVHDIVAFCEQQGILCQGRGSAANSVVCYALGITSVDPVGMELLFERFLSEERGEMPDIDLDIAHQDRERVLQYVYTRHGRDHAALAAEVITYRARSAVRDAGKALGFPLAQVDRLAKSVERRFDSDRDGVPAAWGELADDARLPHLLRLVRGMCGLPRHLSIHVGGMIITGPPLTDMMPVEPAAMPGRTVVPWDKDDLATLGILKIDLLGLGMLTVLDRCLALVNGLHARETLVAPRASDDRHTRGAREAPQAASHGDALALHTVPADDAPTWDMLCAADTVGVFQVESRAQMNCLPRLRPRTFYDLVVEVALIRPGPIQGDMVHPYLRRRAGREAVTYPHPSLEPILKRTLGIPLFQEQGMKIAVTAAGFTPGEADELRRAMGHKRSHQRMASLAERLVAGMQEHGIDRGAAERILQQLSAFADYGFPESHAASFARLVWVSAWLKRHHPAPFLCALLNAQPMGFYPPAVLVSDARRHGVEVRPVDVLRSTWDSRLEDIDADAHGTDAHPVRDEPSPTRTHRRARASPATRGDPAPPPAVAVRLGLGTVRGFGPSHAEGVHAAWASLDAHGPFTSPEDFARRAGLDVRLMEHLARLGALSGFEQRRRQALWRVASLARRVPGPLAEPLPGEAPVSLPSMSAAERVHEDFLLGGITLEQHPVELFRARLAGRGVLPARELAGTSAVRVRVAGMVICRQRPATAHGMTFVTLEDETGFCNLVLTPPVAESQRAGLASQLVLAEGRLERADGVVNLRVERMTPLADAAPLRIESHDYH